MAPQEFSDQALGKKKAKSATNATSTPTTSKSRIKKKPLEPSKRLVKTPSKKRLKPRRTQSVLFCDTIKKPTFADSANAEKDIISKLKKLSVSNTQTAIFSTSSSLNKFTVKEIYGSIISELNKFKPISKPANLSALSDNEICNIIENNSEQVFNSILSDIIYGIEDGTINNSNELGYHVQTAVQMRCQVVN